MVGRQHQGHRQNLVWGVAHI